MFIDGCLVRYGKGGREGRVGEIGECRPGRKARSLGLEPFAMTLKVSTAQVERHERLGAVGRKIEGLARTGDQIEDLW